MVNAAEKAFKEKDIVSAKPLLQEAEWALKDVNHWEKQKNNFVKRQENFTDFFDNLGNLKAQYEHNENGLIVPKRKALFEYRSGGSQYYQCEVNILGKKIARMPFEAPLPNIDLPTFQEKPNLHIEDIKYTPSGMLDVDVTKALNGKNSTTGWEGYKPIVHPEADSGQALRDYVTTAHHYEAPRMIELPSMKKVDKVFGGTEKLEIYGLRDESNAISQDFLKQTKSERALEIRLDYQDRINEEKMNVEFLPTKFGGKTLTVY